MSVAPPLLREFHLCVAVPLLQALLLHNSVIKQAVYNNVGWVVEQEGDSFSVVFHEPEDAVAFTLQVRRGGGRGVRVRLQFSEQELIVHIRSSMSRRCASWVLGEGHKAYGVDFHASMHSSVWVGCALLLALHHRHRTSNSPLL